MKPWLFWLVWGFDALVALGFVYFFVLGIADGSVSSFNIVLWLGMLTALAAILGVGWFFKWKGHPFIALFVLAILAIPALCMGLFFLVVLIANPRMN